MVKLPERPNRVAAAIFAAYEKAANEEAAKDWRRPHLGASQIGDENCLRHLWYGFRWAQRPRRDGRLLRLFERGHREEAWLVDDLRAAGMLVQDRDPDSPVDAETGKRQQYRAWLVDGHFGGSCDGVVLGVPGAPKTWHLLELKSSNKKRFEDLLASNVHKAQPGHYAQMQSYMHALRLTRALYVCACKDDDRLYTERVYYDRTFAEGLIAKAALVISSDIPLSKINEDPAWFECKFCDHRPICHEQRVEQLERNCRTCVSATPHPRGGAWTCELHQRELTVEEQRQGCSAHLFIPALLPWPAVDADESIRWVRYARPDGTRLIDQNRRLTEEIP